MRPFAHYLFAMTFVSSPVAGTPFTPLEWQPKLTTWNGDADGNFIQDELDAMEPTESADVIILLNECLDTGQILDEIGQFGSIVYIGRFLTYVVVSNVVVGDLPAIAAGPHCAMVQLDETGEYGLNVSAAATRKRASAVFSPNTVDDAFPALQGNGRGIAVLDSGVDNGGGPGTTHTFLPAARVTGTYDAVADDDTVDPDDTLGHGTHVAGIALGNTTAFQGVAPSANLVDMLIGTAAPSSSAALRAVDKCIEQKNAWGIDVIQTSFRTALNSNGQDALSQAFNLAVARGIVSVAITMNDGMNLIPPPAAADDVITVGAYDDQGTVAWTDDAVAGFSNFGPRMGDGDGNGLDELKPDVVAPGVAITSTQFNTTGGTVAMGGTSMASPHVSAVAALIIQARPGINPLSVKDMIRRTANPRGGATFPALDAVWNRNWGYGQLDAFGAISSAVTSEPGFPNAPPTCCGCPDVMTATPPEVGTPNTITAVVRNSHPANQVVNATVSFGVYIFGNGSTFFSIAQRTVTIPASTAMNVSVPWTPQASPSGDPHACLKVQIGYGPDTDYSNNVCQRNISIQQNSTATYNAIIENNLTEPATMRIRMADDQQLREGWILELDKNDFVLHPFSCPEFVTVELTSPPNAAAEDMQKVEFEVVADTGEMEILQNGFTVIGCVEGGEPPTIEIVEIFQNEREVTVRDEESGIAHVNVITAEGGNVFVPPFQPGDKEVVLHATADPGGSGSFEVEVWDCAFNTARQDFVILEGGFSRGDCNDDGMVDVSDPITQLTVQFLGEGEILCDDACDSNDDGAVDVSDPIATLSHLFLGDPAVIPAPGTRGCGADPTGDQIGCDSFQSCAP